MTSYDEKKTLPPTEALPGGVFPDEIAAIKKKARGKNASRLKIGIAVGSVVLVILAVVGGTLLGLHLNRKPTVVVRSVQLAIEDEILEETVEVDKEKDTETFCTVSPNGTSFVIRDMKRSLSAYRFDGDEKCYILESVEESEDTPELLEDLEKMEEGEVDVAERQQETFLTVDEKRGHVEPSELSESLVEFCGGLKTHWAVQSSTEPTPSPGATVEEEEEKEDKADAEMGVEVLPGPTAKGTNVVQEREKRDVLALWALARPALRRVCYWVTRNVCSRTCRRVCSKRRRRGLFDWIGRVVRHVVRVVCRAFCTWGCRIVRRLVCEFVG